MQSYPRNKFSDKQEKSIAELHSAIETGSFAEFKKAYDQYPHVGENAIATDGLTPLMRAAKAGNLEIVEFLCSQQTKMKQMKDPRVLGFIGPIGEGRWSLHSALSQAVCFEDYDVSDLVPDSNEKQESKADVKSHVSESKTTEAIIQRRKVIAFLWQKIKETKNYKKRIESYHMDHVCRLAEIIDCAMRVAIQRNNLHFVYQMLIHSKHEKMNSPVINFHQCSTLLLNRNMQPDGHKWMLVLKELPFFSNSFTVHKDKIALEKLTNCSTKEIKEFYLANNLVKLENPNFYEELFRLCSLGKLNESQVEELISWGFKFLEKKNTPKGNLFVYLDTCHRNKLINEAKVLEYFNLFTMKHFIGIYRILVETLQSKILTADQFVAKMVSLLKSDPRNSGEEQPTNNMLFQCLSKSEITGKQFVEIFREMAEKQNIFCQLVQKGFDHRMGEYNYYVSDESRRNFQMEAYNQFIEGFKSKLLTHHEMAQLCDLPSFNLTMSQNQLLKLISSTEIDINDRLAVYESILAKNNHTRNIADETQFILSLFNVDVRFAQAYVAKYAIADLALSNAIKANDKFYLDCFHKGKELPTMLSAVKQGNFPLIKKLFELGSEYPYTLDEEKVCTEIPYLKASTKEPICIYITGLQAICDAATNTRSKDALRNLLGKMSQEDKESFFQVCDNHKPKEPNKISPELIAELREQFGCPPSTTNSTSDTPVVSKKGLEEKVESKDKADAATGEFKKELDIADVVVSAPPPSEEGQVVLSQAVVIQDQPTGLFDHKVSIGTIVGDAPPIDASVQSPVALSLSLPSSPSVACIYDDSLSELKAESKQDYVVDGELQIEGHRQVQSTSQEADPTSLIASASQLGLFGFQKTPASVVRDTFQMFANLAMQGMNTATLAKMGAAFCEALKDEAEKEAASKNQFDMRLDG